jgi:hypothetical protein
MLSPSSYFFIDVGDLYAPKGPRTHAESPPLLDGTVAEPFVTAIHDSPARISFAAS